MQLKPIDQQVVVVVGASSGIGRDAALALSQRGAQVVVAARNQDGLTVLMEQIRQLGGEAIAVVADVAEFEQVKAIADTAITAFGRIDTWVHCAAAGIVAPFETVTLEEFGFNGQRTDDLKSPQAPDGLFEPMAGYEQVEGDFGHLTVPSVSDWLVKLLPGR